MTTDGGTSVRERDGERAPRSGGGRRRLPFRLTLSQVWVFVAVALPVLAALRDDLTTIDLAYGLRAGEVMLDTGRILTSDVFSFTAAGTPWLNQQWGAQVILALLYRATGWAGLALVQTVLFGGVFVLVFLACRAAGARTKHAAWLTVGSFLVAVAGRGLRAQLLGMVLFALTTWIVMDRHRHPRRLWVLPVLVAVWANIHGSFVLVPVLLGLVWLEDRRRRVPGAERALLIAALAAAAATLNPFGLRVWSYAVGISTHPLITSQIEEWQPPTVRDEVGLAFFLSILAVAVLLARRREKVPWTSLLSMGLFVVIGLFAVRGIFWWAIVAPALVATQLHGEPSRPAPERRSPANTAIVLALVALMLVWLPIWRPPGPHGAPQDLLGHAPPGITTQVDRLLSPGDRMFNPQVWGSWFHLALPQHRVFVDARIEVFPRSVWEDYFAVSQGRDGWEDILDRWEIDVVVAHPEQQDELIPLLREDDGWRRAYTDRDGSIFVRA